MNLEELKFIRSLVRDAASWNNYLDAVERRDCIKVDPGNEYSSLSWVLAELIVTRAKNVLLLEALESIRDKNKIDCAPPMVPVPPLQDTPWYRDKRQEVWKLQQVQDEYPDNGIWNNGGRDTD